MAVRILGAEQATPGDICEDFLKRLAAADADPLARKDITNRMRDRTTGALILMVEALTRRMLADHPEILEQAKAHAERALDGAQDDADDGTPAADAPAEPVAPST